MDELRSTAVVAAAAAAASDEHGRMMYVRGAPCRRPAAHMLLGCVEGGDVWSP